MFISDMLTSKDLHRILPIIKVLIIIFLTLVQIQYVCCGITDQIDNQFNNYAFIEPKLFNTRHKREIQSTKINPNGLEHAHDITLTFVDNGQDYIIDLSLNRGLIPVNYFEKHQKDGAHVINRPKADELEFCNYNGKIRNLPNSWAAISTCDGIRGMFFDEISYHYIENAEREPGNKFHILYKHKDLRANFTCGFPSTPEFTPNKIIKRNKRNTNSLKGPYHQNDKSRFIELVLVVDQEEYLSFNSELSKVYQHAKNIANIINSLYIPLNIFITLVGVVVWTEYNEIALVSNGDTTLTNFLHYRRDHLVKDHPNDNAQLLTKIQFENGVVGKALKGPICTYEFSGGVNNDHSIVQGLVASTIAHEIGHNLGMEHDTAECDCPSERCIMASSSGTPGPTHWSLCSMEYLALAFEHGMDYCLRNKPNRLFESPVCGNSFVEEGEQCDCGVKDMCTNPCCNPDTCMFYKNATCATGECCDINTCHFKLAGVECRSALHECDLPEYCTGDSEYCPDNVFKFDGSTCEANKAYCFNGSCRTHADQCRLLWGPTGESSENMCYLGNTKGSPQGNCGYNRLNKTYVKCTQKNIKCGMLQCKHKNERLEFGMETVSIISHTFIDVNGSMTPCRTAIVDLGLNDVDPGLTPNGAKCGENMMCVNQVCMAVEEFRAQSKNCKNNCNGNGVCNNKGNCHCKIGYAPPYCDYPGPGGSDDSGPASSPNTLKGFMTGMYVLTFGAIPLLLAILLFAYCSKNHRTPSDWNKTNRLKLSNDSEIGNKPNGIVSPSSTLLIDNQKPPSLHADLVGNYKGFSIKPLVQSEQPVVCRTPIRPAPSAPATVGVLNERSGRLQISQPVLDATTSSTVHKLVSIPSKPAPPIPTATRPTSLIAAENKNSGVGGGGYPTLRRITSFMKNQKTDEKKHTIPRANAKFDKEELKKLEISHPILQKEINVPSEPLPLEADQHKAVVLRAQSLRVANHTNHKPRVPNFGSMKYKRPTSVAAPTAAASATIACSRPTSPPPPRPPALQPVQVQADYQIPRPLATDCRGNSLETANVSGEEPHSENIYSVIDERPAADVDEDDSCTYKVPRSLESSLLGEIVSAIQERNQESIYTSKPTVDLPPPQQQQQQTYENYKSLSAGSTTSSGYMRPVDVKSRVASYDQPDLVKNCDDNRSLNPSPDVLEAKKLPSTDKPTVLFPKPVVGVANKSALTATVGLKKKLSDGSRYPSKGVADIQKKFENRGNVLKNPPVSTKPTNSGNR
ncbi:disintegrin and metalloproteinase domain-containing protein 9 [Melanaphis sacchari]|uniref:Disintegrin and metalloproteinase domain-containing protein 12 n=1 Tax=Melanaphis sacchari TaxID=742174 RepID=A0A2H8TXB6_9HEMI|nr:disintegrin and metalloproteinase domain-containing protein 9 [Melanaphis sacchari]